MCFCLINSFCIALCQCIIFWLLKCRLLIEDSNHVTLFLRFQVRMASTYDDNTNSIHISVHTVCLHYTMTEQQIFFKTCVSRLWIYIFQCSVSVKPSICITDGWNASLLCCKYLMFVVCWLLSVPATCECISGTDLLRQLYVLPHWDRSCRSNFPSHPVTVYWHQADQSKRWPYNARRLAG